MTENKNMNKNEEKQGLLARMTEMQAENWKPIVDAYLRQAGVLDE